MYKINGMVFLDLHKTGSSHIQKLMEKYIYQEDVFFKKHASVKSRYEPSAIYFLSVRDPLEQYLSLFKYGLSENGNLYNSLKKIGKHDLYSKKDAEGFFEWYSFISSYESVGLLGEGYSDYKEHHDYMGFFSYRLLKLAFRNIKNALRDVRCKEDIEKAISERSIVNFYVRNECLEDDFMKVLDACSSPCFIDRVKLKKPIGEIREEIHDQPKCNVSQVENLRLEGPELSEVKNNIKKQEWIYSLFGY